MLLLLFNDYNSETKTDPAVQEPVKGSRETLLIFNQLCVIALCAVERLPDSLTAGSGTVAKPNTVHTAMTHSWFNIKFPFIFIVFCGDQQ